MSTKKSKSRKRKRAPGGKPNLGPAAAGRGESGPAGRGQAGAEPAGDSPASVVSPQSEEEEAGETGLDSDAADSDAHDADPDGTDPDCADPDCADPDCDDPDCDDEGWDDEDDEDGEEEAEVAELEVVEPAGEVLFHEPGGSWLVALIGPAVLIAVIALEFFGPGPVHWWVWLIFGAVIVGFSCLQVVAARRHVSVTLTETTLQQGAEIIPLKRIAVIYPEHTGGDHQDWQSARALGELYGVPRRRTGIGMRLTDGRLVQAWARDSARLRSELGEAHLAVQLGLEPKGKN